MATSLSKTGRTPHGGVRSEVIFLDDRMRLVDESQATQAEAVEYDRWDNAVFRTYLTIDRGAITNEDVLNCGGPGGTHGPCPKRGDLTKSGEKVMKAFQARIDSSDLSPEQKVKYAQAVKKVLGRMPDKATDAIMANVKSLRFHGSLAALTDHVAQTSPKIAEMRAKGALAYGTFTGDSGTLNLDGEAAVPKDALMPARSNVHEVYAHELTHTVDGPNWQHSRSPEWLSIHEQEFGTRESPRLSRYATSDPRESFAEFGRLVYGTDSDRAAVERHFPRASDYLKQQGLWR